MILYSLNSCSISPPAFPAGDPRARMMFTYDPDVGFSQDFLCFDPLPRVLMLYIERCPIPRRCEIEAVLTLEKRLWDASGHIRGIEAFLVEDYPRQARTIVLI